MSYMSNNWIIEVLRDLQKFSENNQLPTLAEQLNGSLEAAASDLSQLPQHRTLHKEQARLTKS